MVRNLAGVLLLVALPVAAAATQPVAPLERKDYQIFKDISREVTSYPRFTVFDDVQASVDRGVVTLLGKVTMPYKRSDIQQLVSKIPGVLQIRNEIEILPVNMGDDELRYRIAQAIYSNPAFWAYAAMPNPPIHIVVERGHVTLTGVVSTENDRMLARALASSSNAFSVKSNLRTDAEAKAELERIR